MKNPTPPNPAKTDTLLFEHFATLVTAPDGIARLRELILQLAVQGKLGTQDPADEPASVLLERVKMQIGQSDNQKKHRKDLSEIDTDKIPFNLPNNWIWTQIGFICTSPQYGWTTQGATSGETHLLRTTDITSGSINWDIVPFCFEEPSDLGRYLVSDGDIVVSRAGSVGMSYLIKNPKKSVFASYLIRFKPMINREFFALFLKSPYYWSVISEESLGTGVPNVNATKLKNCYFPLPPLAEQHRIVAKVDRLMALCDELEARQQQERAGCLKLGTASLAGLQNAEGPEEFERSWAQVCDAFELILDYPENVAVLRQTILQLAVQGRLVWQEPGDEPARNLVDRIRKEKEQLVKEGKIGKTKLTPEIEYEEIPYPIPKNWTWTRLDHITYISTGSTPSTSMKEYYIGGNIPWVTSSLTSQKFIFASDTRITEKAVKDCSLKIYPKGTLLVALYGQGKTRGQVSELGIPATINQACSAIVFWKNNEPVKDYLKLVLAGNYEKIRSISAGGAQPNLNGDKVKRTLIPLPPLVEQHRIVAKVDALMALCDALESQLKERANMQGRLAGAVVKQVAGGV